MCTSRLHLVVRVADDKSVDVEDLERTVHRVSLLALDGPTPVVGEWIVVHSGYAIDRVPSEDAEVVAQEVRRAQRVEMTESTGEGSR